MLNATKTRSQQDEEEDKELLKEFLSFNKGSSTSVLKQEPAASLGGSSSATTLIGGPAVGGGRGVTSTTASYNFNINKNINNPPEISVTNIDENIPDINMAAYGNAFSFGSAGGLLDFKNNNISTYNMAMMSGGTAGGLDPSSSSSTNNLWNAMRDEDARSEYSALSSYGGDSSYQNLTPQYFGGGGGVPPSSPSLFPASPLMNPGNNLNLNNFSSTSSSNNQQNPLSLTVPGSNYLGGNGSNRGRSGSIASNISSALSSTLGFDSLDFTGNDNYGEMLPFPGAQIIQQIPVPWIQAIHSPTHSVLSDYSSYRGTQSGGSTVGGIYTNENTSLPTIPGPANSDSLESLLTAATAAGPQIARTASALSNVSHHSQQPQTLDASSSSPSPYTYLQFDDFLKNNNHQQTQGSSSTDTFFLDDLNNNNNGGIHWHVTPDVSTLPVTAATKPAKVPKVKSESNLNVPYTDPNPTTLPSGRFWKVLKVDGITMYQCPYPECEKTFTRPYNLKSHYRSHTGERPFVCDQCTSSFSRKHDLRRHQKLHSGEKEHTCKSCGKSFTRQDALNRHFKQNTECVLRIAEMEREEPEQEIQEFPTF